MYKILVVVQKVPDSVKSVLVGVQKVLVIDKKALIRMKNVLAGYR
jgi:hypothetical protein